MLNQLTFDFPAAQSYGAQNYVLTDSNAAAVNLIEMWPQWPMPAAILYGPAGVGKTHLLHIWQYKAGAHMLGLTALNDSLDVSQFGTVNVAIDNVDKIIGYPAAERAVFHVYNWVAQHNGSLLLTAQTPPASWRFLIADLASRLRASGLTEMTEPDDDMMRTLYQKLFVDRQLNVNADVIEWLCRHLPRSAGAAQHAVTALDQAALAMQRPISLWLARRALNLDSDDETV